MRKSTIIGALVIVALWLITATTLYSYNYGSPSDKSHWNQRWENAEASAHFFNTLKRYDTLPFNQHYFAISRPCVDLVKPCVVTDNPPIPGSAVLPSPRINNEAIYISFPPGSMVAAYGVIKAASLILGISISWEMLQWVNMLFWIISIILIYFTISTVTRTSEYSAVISFLSVIPMLFAVEPMHSHQLSMWAHQAFQVFAAAAFLMVAMGINRKTVIALGVISALACWIEWTAYLMCIALFVVVFIHDLKLKLGYKNTIIYTLMAISGGLTLLWYYSFMMGLGPYFDELSNRASIRGMKITYIGWGEWWLSVYQAYGPWLISAFLLALASLCINKSSSFSKDKYITIYILIAIISFMLIENVAMFEHAATYTFDRIKIGFLITILIAMSAMRIEKLGKIAFLFIAIICIITSMYSINQYIDFYPRYWR
ncbi:hypothetical protein Dd1591_3411 [Dickeya chrysanthemi Ech1591]|uniref:Uncharacterized protein n=1 Tax=Dickeya chrysanthemi (strain Ech1591) TaxID=561229 RepID=C6CJJ2_DICC1|nr:hypothetical protein [Dickeya chrysanthemi]ACT08226.1 hypothetical protein Dd1591_3411 [Dickeya chrysanthemi Ech1591]